MNLLRKRKKRNDLDFRDFVYNNYKNIYVTKFYRNRQDQSGYMCLYLITCSNKTIRFEEVLRTSVYKSKYLAEIHIQALFELYTSIDLSRNSTKRIYCETIEIYWHRFMQDYNYKRYFIYYIKNKYRYELKYLEALHADYTDIINRYELNIFLSMSNNYIKILNN